MIPLGGTPESVYGTGGEKYEAYKAARAATAESIQQHWQSMVVGGEVHYFDPAAEVWLSLERAVEQADLRSQNRARIGSSGGHFDRANDYERLMGL